MRFAAFFLCSFGLLPSWAHSATRWARVYENWADKAFSILQATDGGFVAAGSTRAFGARRAWVFKVGSSGEIEWERWYGGGQDAEAFYGDQTLDGGYVVAGYTKSLGAHPNDLWVLKLNSSGGVEWQCAYGGAKDDLAWCVKQTRDKGYIVAGYTSSFGAGRSDLWLLKLTASGAITWQKTYGGANEDWATSIQQTSDGGYIVGGTTQSFGNGLADIWVVKINASGSVAWQKTIGGRDDDAANSIQQTRDGGYIVAGITYSFGSGYVDAWVLKLSAVGIVAWQKAYGSVTEDGVYEIKQTRDGGYVLAGETFFTGLGKAWILKLNSSGGLMWQRIYGGSSDDEAFSVQETKDKGYVFAGTTESFGADLGAAWILRLNSSGQVDPSCGTLVRNVNTRTVNTNAVVTSSNATPKDSVASVKLTKVTGKLSYPDDRLLCSSR